MRFHLHAALVLVVAASGRAQAPATARPTHYAIKAGRLIDGRGGTPVMNVVILVTGDRITAVGSNVAIPAGTPVIDLSRSTVLPGLIDCHDHITEGAEAGPGAQFRGSHVDAAIRGTVYAKRTLEAGFTTIRNLGAPEFVDVALRNAIDRGIVPGPRIFASTLIISATGGHGDANGLSPYLRNTESTGIADGVEEIRAKVRLLVKRGADVIKVTATAGALSEEESVDAALYSQAELDALVDEARMWGRKVAAHAHGAEGIKRAVRAGVASIEHGTFLDEEAARLMVARGTYLSKDSYDDRWLWERAAGFGYSPHIVDKLGKLVQGHEASFKLALRLGVKIAFGTDAGVLPHGENAKQFRDYVAWGMTPMAAIVTATTSAADLLGAGDRLGAIAPGFLADIIATNDNPLADITALERVSFVMKGGAVAKQR